MNTLSFISLPNGSEWFIILFVVLLLFGAKKLPELARGLGKSMGEFKKAKTEFDRELHSAAADEEKDDAKPAAPADTKAQEKKA